MIYFNSSISSPLSHETNNHFHARPFCWFQGLSACKYSAGDVAVGCLLGLFPRLVLVRVGSMVVGMSCSYLNWHITENGISCLCLGPELLSCVAAGWFIRRMSTSAGVTKSSFEAMAQI